MKFIELLKSGKELDCDLIIDNSDMPASFVWDDDIQITEYGYNKFKELLESEYEVLKNGNIEIFCDNYKLGKIFVLSAAGYIGETEFDKIFKFKEF